MATFDKLDYRKNDIQSNTIAIMDQINELQAKHDISFNESLQILTLSEKITNGDNNDILIAEQIKGTQQLLNIAENLSYVLLSLVNSEV